MSQVQWWCAARGEAWSWTWQPYVGVWLFVALFATVYWLLNRRRGADTGERFSKRRTASAIAGFIVLWLALDWPVGALGAGYLASVHALQFVLLAMVVPALLLYGVTPAAVSRLVRSPRLLALMRRLTHPPFTAFFFTFVMVATHASPVLELLMKTQLGSFALDMAWLTSGILLAWPMLVRAPHRPRFIPPLQILYLFAGTLAHVFIGMWFLSAQYPVYRLYELAPRVSGMTALTDQHLAGAAILMLGSPIVALAIMFIFFRWQGTGEEKLVGEERAEHG